MIDELKDHEMNILSTEWNSEIYYCEKLVPTPNDSRVHFTRKGNAQNLKIGRKDKQLARCKKKKLLSHILFVVVPERRRRVEDGLLGEVEHF